jgi:hypothetical protein
LVGFALLSITAVHTRSGHTFDNAGGWPTRRNVKSNIHLFAAIARWVFPSRDRATFSSALAHHTNLSATAFFISFFSTQASYEN